MSARPWPWRAGLLEREAELRAVEDALGGLQQGASGVVLIQGVMGMGKTALLAAAASRAAERGLLQVRQARCCVHDRRVRFAVVRQLHASPARAGSGAEVLAVDDLHDADAWSVSWLTERVAAEGSRPTLLVASICEGEGEDADAAAGGSSGGGGAGGGRGLRGQPGVRVLRPGPLGLEGVGRLTAATLGLPVPLDDPSCRAWLAECLRLTAGHPLWVRELLDRAAAAGLAPLAEAAETLPALAAEVVAEVLASRLDRQHPAALRLARAVSVLGDGCDPATATALADLPGGQARDALRVLARIGLVTGAASGSGPLRFPDPLVRHAVAASMPASALAATSAEAASLLHRHGAPPARIATQLLRGERLSAGWATTVLLQAARQATAAGTPERAKRYLEWALRRSGDARERAALLAELGSVELPIDLAAAATHLRDAVALCDHPRERAPLLVAYADVAHLAGLDGDGALDRALATTIAALHPGGTNGTPGTGSGGGPGQAGDEGDDHSPRAPSSKDGMLLARLQARQLLAALRQPVSGPAPVRTPEGLGAAPASELIPTIPPWLAAHARPGRPGWGASSRDGNAERSAERNAERELLAALAVHSAAAGGAATEALRPALAALERSGDEPGGEPDSGRSAVLLCALDVLVWAERFEDAVAHARRAVEQARQPHLLVRALCIRADAVHRAGVPQRALDYARQALEAATAVGGGRLAVAPLAHAVEALVDLGDVAAAVYLAVVQQPGEAARGAEDWPRFLHARGMVRLAGGDLVGAHSDLAACGAHLAARGIANPAYLPWRSPAAAIHQAFGEHAEAACLLDEQLALARRWGTPRAVGMALHAAGRAGGGGDEDAALRLLEEAVELLSRSRARLDLARALVDLGITRHHRGDLAGARAQLRRGLRLAQRCGAATLAATAYQALLAAGGRPHGYQQNGWGALTDTERKIANLLVLGRANAEIAQTLFITMSTVENHIGRIYAKLGIQRRPQLLSTIIRLASSS